MTAFEAQLNVGSIGLDKSEDNKHVLVHLGIAQMLPFTDGNQPIQAPLGTLSFTIDRETVLNMAEQLKTLGDDLDEVSTSDLAVVGSMQEAEKMAEATEKMTKISGAK